MGMQIPCGVHPEVSAQALYGSLRKHLGGQFRELARHKECEIGEGHLMVDHVHMLVSIPPEILGLAGDRVYERQERHPHCADLWREAKELRGPALLGAGLLGLDRGTQ